MITDMTTYGRTRPARRRTVLISLGAALIVAAGAAAAVVRPSPVTPPGSTVAGIPAGGLSGTRLRAVLDGPVRAQAERTIRLEAQSARIDVRPADLGIRLDVDATATAVGTTRLRLPARDRPVEPVLTVDRATATAALDDRLADVNREPRDRAVRLADPAVVLDLKEDASYTPSPRGVTIDAGEPGRGVDTAVAIDRVAAAVRAGETTVRLDVTTLEPGDATPKLAGVDQLIGTFTTYHPCCAPRVTNIHRMAELVDGTVIAPGATFSLNDTAGERTRARGFVPAPAIVDGELEDQLGGGVSQFSTTLFNAAWFAGLDVVKHQPHTLYIPRYPPGREATLDWRAIDNVIRNDTAAPVVIRVTTTDTAITIGLYGHTGDRKVTSTTGPRQPRATGEGFSIEVRRTVQQDGADAGGKTLRWTYVGFD